MKLLVATRATQGDKPDDFSWTDVGDLITPDQGITPCCTCGCERALSGLLDGRATTTFEVAEVDITIGGLTAKVEQMLRAQYKSYQTITEADIKNDARILARQMRANAEKFEIGQIVGWRRDSGFYNRTRTEN